MQSTTERRNVKSREWGAKFNVNYYNELFENSWNGSLAV